MRIVLDTNTFVGSFFKGYRRGVIDLWKAGHVTLCFSPSILDEYRAVLSHLGLEEEPEIAEMINLFAQGRGVAFTAQTPALQVVNDEPANDKFIACAVALKAPYVVASNLPLLAVRQYVNVQIVSLQDFVSSIAPRHLKETSAPSWTTLDET